MKYYLILLVLKNNLKVYKTLRILYNLFYNNYIWDLT
jgi:hypothetical protein